MGAGSPQRQSLHPLSPPSTAGRQAAPGRASAWTARLTGGGTNGNRLLTAQTGAVLIPLLFVLGITILRVRQLLSAHMFVGMLLIGPVLLKTGSTGYRFVRYYTFNGGYRQAGPPAPLLRMIAPIVVLSTFAVFGTGVALLFEGPASRGALLGLHKASFIVWIVFTALHVIGHVAEIPGALSARYAGALDGLSAEMSDSVPGMRRAVPVNESPGWDAHGTGRAGRILALSGALVAGLVLAIVSISWFGPWLHSAQTFIGK